MQNNVKKIENVKMYYEGIYISNLLSEIENMECENNMILENIKTLSLSDEIIVYWDKPFDALKDTKYEVTALGKTICVDKTHANIQNLEPDTEYTIVVKVCGFEAEYAVTAKTRVKRLVKDVTAYGVKGDNKTLNTKELQKVLDSVNENEMIYFPKGIYLTGALKLHSDMEIYLDKGAVLQGTEEINDYLPKIKSRFEGYEMECFQSLLNLGDLDHDAGYNCENVLIYGEGEIYGGGKNLAKSIAKSETERLKDYIASLGDRIKEYEKPETLASRARGRLINMSNCKNVWIHGLTLGMAPSWNLHFIYSDSIFTDSCTLKSEGIWNGDGWDPDSSTNSTIFNCAFYTEDDSVAIKSGKNPEGNIINRPTKNIRVFDCVTHFGHGICMGSEMSGGIEGVKIWDCEVGPTWSGIEIKATKKRGGYVRNIEVMDVTASHIQMHSVGYNDDGIGAKVPPVFENCKFKRLHLLNRFLDNNAGRNEWHDCPSIDLQGFDVPGHEVNNVSFEDIEIENSNDSLIGSIHMKYCKNISFNNISAVEPTNKY